MKSLFKATRQEPASAGVFKFAFKLGGDEDLEEDGPTKKKSKNKKKKKKPVAGTAENDGVKRSDDIESPENCEAVNDEVDEMESLLKEVQISVENQHIGGLDSATNITANEEKTLSKSQKKNLQKKKAKKSAEQGATEDVAAKGEVAEASVESKKAVKSMKTNSAKNKESKPIVESDDEFAIPEPKVSKKNKNKKPEPKAKAKPTNATTTKPTGLAFAHLAASEPPQRGPHFISSKDPELDEASKLRFKYGMGRNLVAIGPAKVRDPNWLPPPPGLSRPTAPLKGIFGKNVSTEKKASVKAPTIATEVTQEVHSSPFSFSFNGL